MKWGELWGLRWGGCTGRKGGGLLSPITGWGMRGNGLALLIMSNPSIFMQRLRRGRESSVYAESRQGLFLPTTLFILQRQGYTCQESWSCQSHRRDVLGCLCTAHTYVDRQADRQAGRRTAKKTNGQTLRQTDRVHTATLFRAVLFIRVRVNRDNPNESAAAAVGVSLSLPHPALPSYSWWTISIRCCVRLPVIRGMHGSEPSETHPQRSIICTYTVMVWGHTWQINV